jgi:sulfur carrier protein
MERRSEACVMLNGEPRPLSTGETLIQLLRQLGVDPGNSGVAIAVNGDVVARGLWATYRPASGDRIEVVRAIQGG